MAPVWIKGEFSGVMSGVASEDASLFRVRLVQGRVDNLTHVEPPAFAAEQRVFRQDRLEEAYVRLPAPQSPWLRVWLGNIHVVDWTLSQRAEQDGKVHSLIQGTLYGVVDEQDTGTPRVVTKATPAGTARVEGPEHWEPGSEFEGCFSILFGLVWSLFLVVLCGFSSALVWGSVCVLVLGARRSWRLPTHEKWQNRVGVLLCMWGVYLCRGALTADAKASCSPEVVLTPLIMLIPLLVTAVLRRPPAMAVMLLLWSLSMLGLCRAVGNDCVAHTARYAASQVTGMGAPDQPVPTSEYLDDVAHGGNRHAAEERVDVLDALRDPALFFGAQPQRVYLPADALFSLNDDGLLPVANTQLEQLARLLHMEPGRRVILEGHQDDGVDRQALSQRQAEAVRRWLVTQAHINPAQVSAVGMGTSTPLVPPSKVIAEQRANRRIESRVDAEPPPSATPP